MNDVENILNYLQRVQIEQYKIIEYSTKRFSWKNIFGKKNVVVDNEEKMSIFIKCSNPLSEHLLLDYDYNNANVILNNFIFNANSILIENINTQCEKNYLACNFYNQEIWAEQQFLELTQRVNKDLNFSYDMSISKCTMITPIQIITQYYASSTSVFINNKSFKNFTILKDYFCPEDIVNIIEYKFKQLTYKKPKFIGKILIKAEVVSVIINNYISCFYCDQIYTNNSPVMISDLGSNVLPEKFNINSVSFPGVIFDGEGNSCAKKEIIKNGKLVGLICNFKYSQCLKIQMYGNADLKDYNTLNHQRLELEINDFLDTVSKMDFIIESIDNVKYNISKNTICATICYIESSNRNVCKINFDVNMFLSRLFSYGNYKKWHNNVLCSDAYMQDCEFLNDNID